MAGIYDDLIGSDLGEKIDKLEETNRALQNHIQKLDNDVLKLCAEVTQMKKLQQNLSRNISELFKTSKAEIARKDRMIADLRRKLDDFIFRRCDKSDREFAEAVSSSSKRPRNLDHEHDQEHKKQKIDEIHENRRRGDKKMNLHCIDGSNSDTHRRNDSKSRGRSRSRSRERSNGSRYRRSNSKSSRDGHTGYGRDKYGNESSHRHSLSKESNHRNDRFSRKPGDEAIPNKLKENDNVAMDTELRVETQIKEKLGMKLEMSMNIQQNKEPDPFFRKETGLPEFSLMAENHSAESAIMKVEIKEELPNESKNALQGRESHQRRCVPANSFETGINNVRADGDVKIINLVNKTGNTSIASTNISDGNITSSSDKSPNSSLIAKMPFRRRRCVIEIKD